MKTNFIYLLLLVSISNFAQNKLEQRHIDSLYTKALQNRLDWILSSGYKYVDLENQTFSPQKKIINCPIKILPQSEIIEISRKENKELKVYTLSYLIVGKDSVDINFGEYELKALKRKGKNSPLAEISETKRGSIKYEPDFRFVLINNRWEIIKSKFTIK